VSAISPEFKLISDWIKPNTRVLDLGCGDAKLLKHLIDTRKVNGYGMEIDSSKNIEAMKKGINVIHSNLNNHDICHYFDEDSFDYVIMTQALQVVSRPDELLDDMLTVGKQSIITFPNFGHWRMRAQLFFKGRMPETETLPYHWYDTPNVRFFSIDDFEHFCADHAIRVIHRIALDTQAGVHVEEDPNTQADLAIFVIGEAE